MVDKNVVMLTKNKDGSTTKTVQATPGECVKLAAILPALDLTTYGVDKGLASTMDSAAQA